MVHITKVQVWVGGQFVLAKSSSIETDDVDSVVSQGNLALKRPMIEAPAMQTDKRNPR